MCKTVVEPVTLYYVNQNLRKYGHKVRYSWLGRLFLGLSCLEGFFEEKCRNGGNGAALLSSDLLD